MGEKKDVYLDKTNIKFMNKYLRIGLAILQGEVALIILATVAQEVLFDGINYVKSSKTELLLGGFATFIAAILSGFVARLVIKNSNYIVPLGISLLITAETTYLITAGKTGDPLFADMLAGLSLIVGIWIGFYWNEKRDIWSNMFFTMNCKV